VTIKIELTPEIQARVIARATEKGVPVEVYLQTLIESTVNGHEEKPFYEVASNEKYEKALDELALDKPYHFVADSRESIYKEREDSQL